MTVKRILSLIIAFALSVTAFSSFAFADETPDPDITASSAIVIHLDSGTVLFEKNSDKRVSVAFLAKIMTVILALENIDDLNTLITVPALPFYRENDKLTEGERIKAIDLIHCIMLATSNNACYVIATHICESEEAFVDMMNKRAAELGATDTLFTNSNGVVKGNKESPEDFSADGVQHTTASDAAKIVTHALTIERFIDVNAAEGKRETVTFEEIADTVFYKIAKTNKQAARNIYSSNRFRLGNDELFSSSVSGIKTSGNYLGDSICSVKEATLNGLGKQRLLCITMFSERGEALYNDTNRLWSYCFSNYRYVKLVGEGQIAKTVKVKLGSNTDKVNLISTSEVSGFIFGEYSRDKLEYKGVVPEYVTAPISKGETVCAFEIVYDGKSYGTVEFAAAASVTRDELDYLFAQISDFFSSIYVKIFSILIFLAIALYIGYAVFYNKKKKRARAKKVRNRFRF
ncbi:MAG: D-alanyl-D-alanine carboxypeptidase [Clostridia bacterium]|nr:D-alanyl-D-alanine carboxypeptidase [Clostridia bacterium]